jgi:hypothetical protein
LLHPVLLDSPLVFFTRLDENKMLDDSQLASIQSCESSRIGCALPVKYLLPTPHHLNSNSGGESNTQGLSYFLDSTCESGKADGGEMSSARPEFPSGVEPLYTPQWQRNEERRTNPFEVPFLFFLFCFRL